MSTSRTEVAAEPGLAERFALVRRVADDLAHELKNPLNAMVINMEVLRTRVRAGNTDAALERLDVLQQETRRLLQLLDQVLRLIRPDEMETADFALGALLEEVGGLARVLAKLARRRFELRPVSEELRVHGVREPLRFALLALCEAAVAGTDGEDDVVLLEAVPGPEVVQLTLEAPASAASRLQAALPAVARLLAEDGAPLGVAMDESGCRVRIALARAAA